MRINIVKDNKYKDVFFINVLYLFNFSLNLILLDQLIRIDIFIKFIFNDIEIDNYDFITSLQNNNLYYFHIRKS